MGTLAAPSGIRAGGRSWSPLRVAVALLALAAITFENPPPAGADRATVRVPGETRPELPPFEPPQPAPTHILPPIEIPPEIAPEEAPGLPRVHVREIRLSGNTVLPEEDLKAIVRPYEQQSLTASQIMALRDALTLLYVERGYVTSGATLPDQNLEEGIVEFRIVEGVVTDVEIETDGRYRTSRLRTLLGGSIEGPVNIFELEERLQIMRQDRRILAVEANLLPGAARGESTLRVRVREAKPYHAGIEFSNYQAPAIGSLRGVFDAAYLNVSGHGDQVDASYRKSAGLDEVRGRYDFPLGRYGTSLGVHVRANWSEVVEEPFDVLEIESENLSLGFRVRQPVHRTIRSDAALFLIGEFRRSESSLLGSGAGLSEGVPEDGVAKVAVLRIGGDWTSRGRRYALAVRSTVNVGLDALDATVNPGRTADGRFVSWLFQAQLAHRLPGVGSQLILRGDLQLSDSPLLGMEQFSVGGHSTVRGYRENTLVRDQGAVLSAEFRFPLWIGSDDRVLMEIAPFIDAGYAWNKDRPTPRFSTLLSVGLGGRWQITRWLRAQLYWGRRLREVPGNRKWDLQDAGIHFGLWANYP